MITRIIQKKQEPEKENPEKTQEKERVKAKSPGTRTYLPVDIVFVLDVSGSMHGYPAMQAIEMIGKIVSFLRSLPGDFYVSVIAYGDDATIHVWRESVMDVQLPTYKEVYCGNDNYLNRGIDCATTMMGLTAPATRAIFIILSDFIEERSKINEAAKIMTRGRRKKGWVFLSCRHVHWAAGSHQIASSQSNIFTIGTPVISDLHFNHILNLRELSRYF